MTKEQQELYDKLLKKVNEYCLGYAAEDVIAAIDALVDTYETKVESASEPLESYRKCLKEWESGHSVDFSKVRFELQNLLPDPDNIAKKLKALEIIYTKEVDINWLTLQFDGSDLKDLIKYVKDFPAMCSSEPLTEEEIILIKETYDETTK